MDSSNTAAAARQPWRFGSIILALALLTGAAACAYGFFAWTTVAREESQRLENLARVAGRAATLFYSQFGIALGDLGDELADEPETPSHRRLQHMLDRTRSYAPTLRLIGVLGPDGELLSASSQLPGKLDPAELAFPTAENLRTVRTRYALEVGRPVHSAHFGQWMIPLRHVIRHPSGKVRLTLFALAAFDDQATVFGDLAVPGDWVIGILRNDRYYQGRWPASANPVDVYARPFAGPIERWLAENPDRASGYFVGVSPITGDKRLLAVHRLENQPMTLFLSAPYGMLWSRWFAAVHVPFLLFLFLATGALWMGRRMAAQQALWSREVQQRQSRLELLHRIATEIAGGTPVVQVIRRTLTALAERYPEFRACYSTLDNDGRLEVRDSVQPPHIDDITGLVLDYGTDPEYLARLRRGEVCTREHWGSDEIRTGTAVRRALPVRASLEVSVAAPGGLIGLLCLDAARPHGRTTGPTTNARRCAK